MMDKDTAFKKQKKAFKDITPLKDEITELEEGEPKNLEDIKKRLGKRI